MIVVEQRAVGDLVVQGAIGDACEHYRGLVRATVIAYAELLALPAAAFSHRLIAQGLGQCHAIAHLARDSARSLGIKPVRVRSDGNHHWLELPDGARLEGRTGSLLVVYKPGSLLVVYKQ